MCFAGLLSSNCTSNYVADITANSNAACHAVKQTYFYTVLDRNGKPKRQPDCNTVKHTHCYAVSQTNGQPNRHPNCRAIDLSHANGNPKRHAHCNAND